MTYYENMLTRSTVFLTCRQHHMDCARLGGGALPALRAGQTSGGGLITRRGVPTALR